MNLIDLPWGFWNGLTAWIVLIVHVFGGWSEYPLFDLARAGNWYEFGFLIGAGPFVHYRIRFSRTPPTEHRRSHPPFDRASRYARMSFTTWP